MTNDYLKWRKRHHRNAVLGKVATWIGLIILCLFTLLGMWTFFTFAAALVWSS